MNFHNAFCTHENFEPLFRTVLIFLIVFPVIIVASHWLLRRIHIVILFVLAEAAATHGGLLDRPADFHSRTCYLLE